jgi:hypothetical protein
MLWMEMLFAFVIALLFSVVFITIFKIKGPIGVFWIFMSIIFLVTLIATRWAKPAGPPFVGVYWIPGLVAAVIASLIIGASAAVYQNLEDHHPKRGRPVKLTSSDESEGTVGGIIWLLLMILGIVAFLGVVL